MACSEAYRHAAMTHGQRVVAMAEVDLGPGRPPDDAGSHLHSPARARRRRAAGVTGDQLRSSAEHAVLLAPHRAQRPFRPAGVAFYFVTNNDVRSMKGIVRYYRTQFVEMPMDIADLV